MTGMLHVTQSISLTRLQPLLCNQSYCLPRVIKHIPNRVLVADSRLYRLQLIICRNQCSALTSGEICK